MPDESRHESADLDDYSVQEPADSLTGEPGEAGDDPLDRGVIPPERWSAGIKFGSTADEQESGESLDQLLAEEEPDTAFDLDDDLPEDSDDDEEADARAARFAVSLAPTFDEARRIALGSARLRQRAAAINALAPHPFTAPAIRPLASRRWVTRKNARTGMVKRVEEAMIAPQLVEFWP